MVETSWIKCLDQWPEDHLWFNYINTQEVHALECWPPRCIINFQSQWLLIKLCIPLSAPAPPPAMVHVTSVCSVLCFFFLYIYFFLFWCVSLIIRDYTMVSVRYIKKKNKKVFFFTWDKIQQRQLQKKKRARCNELVMKWQWSNDIWRVCMLCVLYCHRERESFVMCPL